MRNAFRLANLSRLLPRLFLVIMPFALLRAPAYAQNENEAVGFQSHHAFDSGVYGESIDILNGAVNVVTPIVHPPEIRPSNER